MNKRWGKIESIFNKVLEADESRRSALLEESCAGDESLKREVESLLAHHQTAEDFIERPAFEDVDSMAQPGPPAHQETRTWRSDPAQANLKGALVAHYRVLEEIGLGGMGVVYKAEDLNLGRPVALKFLPERLAVDSVAVERFRREARAASALNHPNICTIYEIEQHDGREFIAMEFLDGQTLATYIAGRAHSGDSVAKLGVPIAEALAAAHSKGVIHRDVKPRNIFVTSSGLVKVLDFGVAKLLQATDATSTLDTLTETNAITGTLPYMSPEQLRGEDLDARSDIYALGVVLYEIATGQRPYTSSLHGKLIDEILHRPAPAPSGTNRKLPPKLDEIILKCLEKDPENRYQTAKEIAVDLRRMSTPTTGQVPVLPKRRNRSLIFISAGAALLLVAALTWLFIPGREPKIVGSAQLTHDGYAIHPSIVSDGSRIYFNQMNTPAEGITQVSVHGGETAAFPTPVKGALVRDISPDHSQLLAISGCDNVGNGCSLWGLPLPAGSPRRLGSSKTDTLSSWSPDGQSMVFTSGPDLWLAKSDGSEPRRITALKIGYPLQPVFSPDSKRIRFSILDGQAHTSSIWEVKPDGADLHAILPGWHNPPHECCGIWTPEGKYYIFRTTSNNNFTEIWGSGDLFAIRDSPRIFQKSTPTQLTFGPLTYMIGSVTQDGKRILVAATARRAELDHYDAASNRFVPFLGGPAITNVAFSRDSKRIAYVRLSDDTLWTSRIDGSEKLQLTYPPERAGLPRWSPDGQQIAFMRYQTGKAWKAVIIPVQGGTAEELFPGNTIEGDPNWAPDGTRIAFSTGIPEAARQAADIRIMDLRTRHVAPVPGSSGKFSPRWSSDGRYLAALDFVAFPTKLFIFDFRTSEWADWLIDQDVIEYPAWTRDSKSVVYCGNVGCKKARIGSNRPELLFGVAGFPVLVGDFGIWSDNAWDDSRMVVRDASNEDIYALDVEFP